MLSQYISVLMLIVCSFKAQLDACKAISKLGQQEANCASVDDEHSVFDDENSTLSDKTATVLQTEMEEINEDNESSSFPIENFGALMDAFGIEYNHYKNVPAVKTRTNPDAKQMLLDDRHHGNQKISVILNVLLDVVVAASSLILPGDPQFLIEQACDSLATKFCGDATNKRVSTMESMTQNLFLICKNMPRNTGFSDCSCYCHGIRIAE